MYPIYATIISCSVPMMKAEYTLVHVGHHNWTAFNDAYLYYTELEMETEEHMLGMGGIVGGVVSFSALFGYNPVVVIPVYTYCRVLGTARIILQHHTLSEVLTGFVVGFICSLLVLHPIANILFRIFLL